MFASCEIHFILDYLNEITVGGATIGRLKAYYLDFFVVFLADFFGSAF